VGLRELRRALSNDNELILQHAIDAGIIEIVLTVLQGTCVDSQVSFVGFSFRYLQVSVDIALDAGFIQIVLTVLQGTCVDSRVSFAGLF